MGQVFGLRESVANGVGAMIGGGIFAVLGIAIGIAGRASVISYLLASIIAIACGYSYTVLSNHIRDDGGSFTFIESFRPNAEGKATFIGWTLVLGYIGSVAMYAFTFGAFFNELIGTTILPSKAIQSIFSIAILLTFFFVNMKGAKTSGTSELIMVSFKVVVLLLISAIGFGAILTGHIHPASKPFFNRGATTPFLAIGVIFVSFQGFQLLSYEYETMKDPQKTVRQGILISILLSSVIYLLVSYLTSTLLTAELIKKKKETVLAYVLYQVFQQPLLQNLSYYLIVLTALFSTASAINATLFGTARLMGKIAGEGGLPHLFSFKDREDIPLTNLVVITGLCIVATLVAPLELISTFASLSFLIVFNVVCYLAYSEDVGAKRPVVLLGLLGTFFGIGTYVVYAIVTKPMYLVSIAGIYFAVAIIEFGYLRDRRNDS